MADETTLAREHEVNRGMPGTLTPSRWRAVVKSDWQRSAAGWERYEPQFMYSLAAVDPSLMRALDPRPGQRILDIGCGSGDPSLAFAQLVAPRGSVVGLDIAARMLAIARRRARDREITNARFVVGDAGRWSPESRGRLRFDGVVSRYGLMFVADLPSTLARVRAMLKPGGRIAAAAWGPADRNPFFKVRMDAVLPFMKTPGPDPEHAPHPLRLARPGLLARLMRRAGFKRVKAEGVRAPFIYNSLEEYLEMTLTTPSPLRDLFLTLSRRDQARVRDRLVRGMRPFRSGPLIRAPGFAWVVSGRR